MNSSIEPINEFIARNFKTDGECAEFFNVANNQITRWKQANALIVDGKVYVPSAKKPRLNPQRKVERKKENKSQHYVHVK